ncbi:MAG TPA: putative metal-dependent hydrolase [Chitinophagaceae bacterium]|nr:putative metal-dependent hydrolase [Chitinophagaceae bacterium]
MAPEVTDLSFPIGKQSAWHADKAEYNEAAKNEMLNDIRLLPDALERAVQNLNEEQLHTPYRPGGWTVHQLVHHVADSHINAYLRFKLGLTEDNPTIKTYDQDAWALLSDTEKLPVNISLTLLHALHRRWCQLLSDITPEQWQRTVYHPERKGEITLWQLLKTYSWHSVHHTAHINKLRERMHW